MDKPLVWMEDLGMGYCPTPVAPDLYDKDYFDKYVRYAATEKGQRLNDFRNSIVDRWLTKYDRVLDIGIGCGEFIKLRGDFTFGFDINPLAVAWLQGREAYVDPRHGFDNMTFWDSLEHIPNASTIVAGCRQFAFVTMPIYESAEHCLASRHFRPGEHIWYFTRNGLIRWFRGLGFDFKESSTEESRIGRADIETFVFRRVRHA